MRKEHSMGKSTPIRILAVGAHPADAFDQAGGTLAHHVAEGDQVSALILTGGANSHDWRLQDRHMQADESFNRGKEIDASKDEKTDEVRRACAELGIKDLHFLGREDDEELLTQEMIFEIAEKFRELRPHIVITHHPYEEGGFKLHASAGRGVLYARRACTASSRLPGTPYLVPIVYFMSPMAYVQHNSLNQGSFFRPDVYVDITDVVEKKIRAIDCIQTQYYGGLYARKTVEISDGLSGNIAWTSYAEQFQRFTPPLCYKLPISEFEIRTAEEPREETMLRRGYMLDHMASIPEAQRPKGLPYEFRRDLYDR
jgi:LmbE family N-acetylglucosaminyl deacetylase